MRRDKAVKADANGNQTGRTQAGAGPDPGRTRNIVCGSESALHAQRFSRVALFCDVAPRCADITREWWPIRAPVMVRIRGRDSETK